LTYPINVKTNRSSWKVRS